MVVLRLTELTLDSQVEHLATDWQVSTTLAFNNVILESIEDYDNKSSISFSSVLDPNRQYYARARALLSTGYTVWGNLDVFTPTNVYDLDKVNDIPSRVSIPVLNTSSDPKNHDASLFTLTVSGFDVVGNATHLSTSWFIEKFNGDVVWSKIKDELHKESINVNDLVLEDNEVYRIKAMFHSTSNDSSQLATKTIHVRNNTGVTLSTELAQINVHNDTTLRVFPSVDLETVEWEILFINNELITTVWSATEINSKLTTTLLADTLKENTLYLLRIKSNVSDSWKYYPFFTYVYNEPIT